MYLSGPACPPAKHTSMNEMASLRALPGMALSIHFATVVEPERGAPMRAAKRMDVSEGGFFGAAMSSRGAGSSSTTPCSRWAAGATCFATS